MTYECEICDSVNHCKRLHCQNCGTIPTVYSMIGKPAVAKGEQQFSHWIPIVKARGFSVMRKLAGKMYLRTVPLTYYADSDKENAG